MKNADKPANPIGDNDGFPRWINELAPQTESRVIGLTKREKFCLHAGVPATGDEELDGIIREGARRRMAGQIAAAVISGKFAFGSELDAGSISVTADKVSAHILAELEKGDGEG